MMPEKARQIQILLCEDDPDHQNLLLRALVNNSERIDVTVVGTGNQFIRAIEQQKFDCVILDYYLGIDTAPELIRQAQSRLGNCPVLVISSSHDQRAVAESIRSGVVDFISKSDAVLDGHLWRRVMVGIEASRKQRISNRMAERRERYLAMASETDGLTGLYNRQYFDHWVREGRWRNDRRRYQCCVMVDIDSLQQVNDSYGHEAGDHVMKAVAKIIREHTGTSGVVVRLNEDEFLAVHPLREQTDCVLHAEQLRKKIAQSEIEFDGRCLLVNASIGVIHVGSDRLGNDTLDQARCALTLAKTLGRNTVCSWEMVLIDQILAEVPGEDGSSPERQRRQFLSNIRSLLGPTQWDHITRHGARVSDTACRIAHALGMGLEEISRIRLGALLHDIGKCLIPENLLAKPSSLVIEEWALIARHADLGAWIATRLGVDQQTSMIIRHHHSRYDRSVSGMKIGNTIPLGARILCVADALVTMMTDRPYRARMSFVQAHRELQKESGKQFDPGIVDLVWFARDQSLLEAA